MVVLLPKLSAKVGEKYFSHARRIYHVNTWKMVGVTVLCTYIFENTLRIIIEYAFTCFLVVVEHIISYWQFHQCHIFTRCWQSGWNYTATLFHKEKIGSLQITNLNGNINWNAKNLFKTSHAALILNGFFTFVFMFPICFNSQTPYYWLQTVHYNISDSLIYKNAQWL